MAGINRYYQPIGTVQLGHAAQIPFEQMAQAMGHHQQRYDLVNQAALDAKDREFDFLKEDAQEAAKLLESQEKLYEDIVGMGDLSRNSSDALKKLRGFAKTNYGKFGKATAIQSSYNNYQKTVENIMSSDLPQNQKQLAIARLRSEYKGIGQGQDMGFGRKTYNTFSVSTPPEYIDLVEKSMSIMKEMDPRVLEEQGITLTPDNRWVRTMYGKVEELSQEELIRVAMPILQNDPKVSSYLQFESQNYGYLLDQNPNALQSINDARKASYQKQLSKYDNDKKELDRAKEVVKGTGLTIKEQQEEVNKLIDLFGLQIPKLVEDGVMGPKTKEALGYLEVATKNIKLEDPGTFTPFDKDAAVGDYYESRITGAVQSTADIYDKYNVSKKESWQANPYQLDAEKQARGFSYWRRKQEIEENALTRTINLPGVKPTKNKAPTYMEISKDGNLTVSEEHPELEKARKTMEAAKRSKTAQTIWDGVKGGFNLMPQPSEGGAKAHYAYAKAKKEYEEVKARLEKGYKEELEFYKGSMLYYKRQEAEAQGKDPKTVTMTDAEAVALYNQMQKGYETQSGIGVLPNTAKELKDMTTLAKGMTKEYLATNEAYTIGADKEPKRIDSDFWIESGTVSFNSYIDPANNPFGWASGYYMTAKDGLGNTKQIYLKTSSIEQDAVYKAAADAALIENSFELRKQVPVVDANENYLFTAVALKGFDPTTNTKFHNIGIPENEGYRLGNARIQPKQVIDGMFVITPKQFEQLLEKETGVGIRTHIE